MTIDCPSDCIHLIASRRHEEQKPLQKPDNLPFDDVSISSSFLRTHGDLILALSYAVCAYARDHRELTDRDALQALESLAASYQTLAKGILYEKPPMAPLQRGLYDALREGIQAFRKEQERKGSLVGSHDAEVRDGLIVLTQAGAARHNGRPRSRAYLDLLRSQFDADEFSPTAVRMITLP